MIESKQGGLQMLQDLMGQARNLAFFHPKSNDTF